MLSLRLASPAIQPTLIADNAGGDHRRLSLTSSETGLNDGLDANGFALCGQF